MRADPTGNVFDKRTDKISERIIFPPPHHLYFLQRFPLPRKMAAPSKEAKLNLALQALEKDPKPRLSAAAKIYSVPYTTLYHRRDGRPSRRDIPANSRKLTDLEERTIVQYIIELCVRAFPPRLRFIEDMANRLLRERDAPLVGKRWAHNFVKRQPELRTRFTRRYDYQRAKCEDPEVIREWFTLVHNTKARYGILDDNIYNFDETGFAMGLITTGMVITTSDSYGKVKK